MCMCVKGFCFFLGSVSFLFLSLCSVVQNMHVTVYIRELTHHKPQMHIHILIHRVNVMNFRRVPLMVTLQD